MKPSPSRYHPVTGLHTTENNSQHIYGKLAPLYDDIMRDVDYNEWTDYIHSVIQTHHLHGTHMLELACGTGTMALAMEEQEDYDITATDGSPDMIRIAREKAKKQKSEIRWRIRNMRRIELDETFDIIFMVFDSLNYLQREEHIRELFASAGKHLNPDGIFIFDFTTPSYSPKIELLLNEERNVGNRFHYLRSNTYDFDRKIHTNRFNVVEHDSKSGEIIDRFEELHTQRIWTLREIKHMVLQSDLCMLAAYEDFDFSQATDKSDRITMVLTHG